MLRPFIVACLASTLLAADPPAVAKVLNELAKAEESANRTHQATLAKAKEKAISDLVRIQEGFTRKGDLDGALLVRERILGLSADVDLLGNSTRTLSSPSAEALAKRIAAGAITADDYAKHAGNEFVVDARETLDTRVIIQAAERYLVLPKPDDTWAAAPDGPHAERVNYRGRDPRDPRFVEAPMSLVIRVGDAVMSGFIAHGEGSIRLGAMDTGTDDNIGERRIKLIRIR